MIQAIMSLKPTYGDLILSGDKTVELRNRVVRVDPGTKVWIYVTHPASHIVAVADVELVVHDKPSVIWNRFGKRICIDKDRFDSYVGSRNRVSALVLSSVIKLNDPLTLDGIRRKVRTFHPPQFYTYLSPGSGLFSTLNRALNVHDVHGSNGCG